jgi:transcriptional regulator with XRE-family HTH domain
MSTLTEERCATLLRELRRKKGWTLQECEEISGGAIKSVVLGSYERGHRAISIARLEQLAGFYGVPIEYFFTSSATENYSESRKLIFDIRRIRVLRDVQPGAETVKKFLASVAAHRRDWNGEVISLRASDTETLALVNEVSVSELIEELRFAGFLFASELNERQNP